MRGASMVEFDDVDLDKNSVISRNEWNLLMLEDKRRAMIDEDMKRNAERRFTGCALAGMLLYPLVILLASWMGFDKAASLITDIASVYVIAASGIVGAFIGFNSMSAKSNKASISYDKGEGK